MVTPDGKPFLSLGVNHIQNIFNNGFSGDRQEECESVFQHLTSWNFNTAGYGSPQPLSWLMPNMAPMYLTMNANYMTDSQFYYSDIFDPNVQDKMKAIIQHVVREQQGNPSLIGYYWTDTPQWDLERARKKRGTDWVSTIRNLPASAPGKKRYEQFLAEGGTSDEEFLRLIARELYRVIGEETRRLAPDALIFGERYLVNDHPDCVIEEALQYIDVLSIQPGGAMFNASHYDLLHTKFKKPIMLCDHQRSFATPEYPKTMWQQMESEEAAGQSYAQYLKDAFSKPYIIGYQRCQYVDRFAAYAGVLKQGLIREDGAPYKTLTQYITKANAAAIERFQTLGK
ncbi:hypothetical protein ACFL50_03810 [Candidatus Latescibacterota bacterium]